MNTSAYFDSVADFHRAFSMPVLDKLQKPDLSRLKLRARLIMEEARELEEALTHDVPLAEVLKESSDLVYVLVGTLLEIGCSPETFQEAFRQVHENNMGKLWPDGKPRYREDGKLLKPVNYQKVDLSPLTGGQ